MTSFFIEIESAMVAVLNGYGVHFTSGGVVKV
ncbi:hypothetical protein EMIT0P2_200042 [Pseudomonas sp. IT-P2]